MKYLLIASIVFLIGCDGGQGNYKPRQYSMGELKKMSKVLDTIQKENAEFIKKCGIDY